MGVFLLSSLWALTPVFKVDLKQYVGVWHEIARLPNSYETNCAHNTAEYTLSEDGLLAVLNRCVKTNGHTREVKGIARVENPPNNSKLSVNFVPNWLSWSGLGWEDYWIIDLDKNYQFAVISEPHQDYLWIFSRTPSMKKQTYDTIIAKLKSLHFHLSHLIVSGEIVSTPQNSKPPVLEASLFH